MPWEILRFLSRASGIESQDKKMEKDKQIWNMEGKTVVVTGANRGIGRVMARELARSGAKVVMGCRSVDHALQVREEIRSEFGSGDLEVREMDLAEPESVRRFAESFAADHPRLDVLVNNAGISMKEPVRTASGLEITFATNVLGPQLLTGLLMNSLRPAAPSRIINVASDFAGNLDIDDLQFERRRFNGTKAYRQSKQANRMLTREWARRLHADRITANSMTPGLMPETDLFRDASPGEKRFMRLLGRLFGVGVEEGADTALWLACEPGLENATGGFYEKRKLRKCKFTDPEAESALWQCCEDLIKTRLK
jgi:NAD(P)-dependent dehydrogenase (short-subunit alcohol dehydrogenase family)